MENFLPFFLVLFASLFSSTVFRLFHLPWVVILIFTGILIGPQGFDVIQENQIITFAAETGLIFLMFMAGLESKLSSLRGFSRQIAFLSIINGLFPFLVGLGIGLYFEYNLLTAILIGIIFVSSSIAVIVPSLEANKLLNTRLGKSVMTSSIFQDIASMVLLSIFLQTEDPLARVPKIIFYPLLAIALIALRYVAPKIQQFFAAKTGKDVFQQEVRSLFVILLGVVLAFEVLGLHPIIAGFFTGFILADSISNELLLGKVRAIGYGVFVPIFFINIGMQTDILVFRQAQSVVWLTLAIFVGSALSKFFSGTLGAKLVGFNWPQSTFFGVSSVPQLSTTLAATIVAASLGLITAELTTALIVLSLLTTMIGPSLMALFKEEVLVQEDIQAKKQLAKHSF